jgi:hypothetical protein
MTDCEFQESCFFFNDHMQGMPDQAELFKQLYCHGGNDICARYMIFKKLGREAVPNNLFPNEITRANIILPTANKTVRKA